MEREPIPNNCFVAMFDIIGFKALRAKNGTSGLHRHYTRGILPAIQHSAAGKGKTVLVNGKSVYVPDFTKESIGFRAFSDSVLFFTEDDSFISFVRIIHSSFQLLQSGFGGGQAPYRGAVGWGDLINDPNGILIGSALEDAYIGESSQAWAGAMLTESCKKYCEDNKYIEGYKEFHINLMPHATDEKGKENLIKNSKRIVEYNVPIQTNPKDSIAKYSLFKTYAIDWTIRMFEGASNRAFLPSGSKHAQTISGNTIAFEEWARTNNL